MFGIARSSEHHTDRRRAPIQIPRETGFGEQLREISRKTVQKRLSLGIAQAHVELEQLRPILRHHQACVEKAGEGMAFLAHAGERGQDNPLHHFPALLGSQNAPVAIGAHAACVWAAVAIKDALVILRGSKGQKLLAAAQADEADLFTLQKLFENQVGAEASQRGYSLLLLMGDDDTLARCEA